MIIRGDPKRPTKWHIECEGYDHLVMIQVGDEEPRPFDRSKDMDRAILALLLGSTHEPDQAA